MLRAMLLSAKYDNQRGQVNLKFYDKVENKLHTVAGLRDYPHCFADPEQEERVKRYQDVRSIQHVTVNDILTNKPRPMIRIETHNPSTIYDIREEIPTWESDIRYYQSYLYDHNLTVGCWYDIHSNGTIHTVGFESKEDTRAIKDKESDVRFDVEAEKWRMLFDQPIPAIKRVAIDIEVETDEGRLPNAESADQKVTAIGFDSPDFQKVFILNENQEPLVDKESRIVSYKSEGAMLHDAFNVMDSYPVVITFNGDNFDLPYLHNRAKRLGVRNSPIIVLKMSSLLENSIHLDLFPLFKNKSLRTYTFGAKYSDLSLNTIAEAIIGEKKLEHIEFNEMTKMDLAKYCYNDARITYKLTSYNSDLVMNILILLCRIAKSPLEDVNRLGLNHWIKNMFHMHQRCTGTLIPNREEFDARTVDLGEKAVIDGKKYKGAIVLEPEKGLHFNVKCMDFSSLYPSIIKNYNVSFETTRCSHEECKKNKIGDIPHWFCTKEIGIASLLIGSLMTLRVNYYKPKSKDKKLDKLAIEKYSTIEQTLKIILNGSYGTIGFEKFPYFFLPTAESVTGIGRHIITQTVNIAKQIGTHPLYGDTDSLFLKNPTDKQIFMLINETKEEYNIELAVDKEYRYMVLSDRKKNYLGINHDGTCDIKGLTGKKSHTPQFIKDLFTQMTGSLSEVFTVQDFDVKKEKIQEYIRVSHKALLERRIPLEDLSISMSLAKNPEEYTKTTPQHLKAAKMLKRKVKAGEHIKFVKTYGKIGVCPVEQAKIYNINTQKYRELMKSTLEQVLDPLNIGFDDTVFIHKTSKMEDYFG